MNDRRLYFDHDSAANELVASLRRAGHDCLTSAEVGHQRHSDPEQLAFAASEGRILVTPNARDFRRLHSDTLNGGDHHAGIVIVIQSANVGAKLRMFDAMFSQVGADEFADRLEYLSNWA